jgi:hypothetical protein
MTMGMLSSFTVFSYFSTDVSCNNKQTFRQLVKESHTHGNPALMQIKEQNQIQELE